MNAVEPETTGRARRGEARGSARTCVGCRDVTDPDELVRVVLGPDGEVVFDLAGGSFGRGAWMHPVARCLDLAPRGLARSFRAPVAVTPAVLRERLADAANRRVEGLLGAAQRSRHLAIGTDAVDASLKLGEAVLVLVASDARAAATGDRVREAVARGLARAWGTKARLGAALGRGDTGVVAISERGLARALEQAVFMSQVPDAQRSPSR